MLLPMMNFLEILSVVLCVKGFCQVKKLGENFVFIWAKSPVGNFGGFLMLGNVLSKHLWKMRNKLFIIRHAIC